MATAVPMPVTCGTWGRARISAGLLPWMLLVQMIPTGTSENPASILFKLYVLTIQTELNGQKMDELPLVKSNTITWTLP